mmetsp:Transcript_26688/g.72095  ORF Transcript_26688/g.72095 Transcript_26688/m.72095 type:complete len:209 (-) Transcript_26688:3892-4518(-)
MATHAWIVFINTSKSRFKASAESSTRVDTCVQASSSQSSTMFSVARWKSLGNAMMRRCKAASLDSRRSNTCKFARQRSTKNSCSTLSLAPVRSVSDHCTPAARATGLRLLMMACCSSCLNRPGKCALHMRWVTSSSMASADLPTSTSSRVTGLPSTPATCITVFTVSRQLKPLCVSLRFASNTWTFDMWQDRRAKVRRPLPGGPTRIM